MILRKFDKTILLVLITTCSVLKLTSGTFWFDIKETVEKEKNERNKSNFFARELGEANDLMDGFFDIDRELYSLLNYSCNNLLRRITRNEVDQIFENKSSVQKQQTSTPQNKTFMKAIKKSRVHRFADNTKKMGNKNPNEVIFRLFSNSCKMDPAVVQKIKKRDVKNKQMKRKSKHANISDKNVVTISSLIKTQPQHTDNFIQSAEFRKQPKGIIRETRVIKILPSLEKFRNDIFVDDLDQSKFSLDPEGVNSNGELSFTVDTNNGSTGDNWWIQESDRPIFEDSIFPLTRWRWESKPNNMFSDIFRLFSMLAPQFPFIHGKFYPRSPRTKNSKMTTDRTDFSFEDGQTTKSESETLQPIIENLRNKRRADLHLPSILSKYHIFKKAFGKHKSNEADKMKSGFSLNNVISSSYPNRDGSEIRKREVLSENYNKTIFIPHVTNSTESSKNLSVFTVDNEKDEVKTETININNEKTLNLTISDQFNSTNFTGSNSELEGNNETSSINHNSTITTLVTKLEELKTSPTEQLSQLEQETTMSDIKKNSDDISINIDEDGNSSVVNNATTLDNASSFSSSVISMDIESQNNKFVQPYQVNPSDTLNNYVDTSFEENPELKGSKGGLSDESVSENDKPSEESSTDVLLVILCVIPGVVGIMIVFTLVAIWLIQKKPISFSAAGTSDNQRAEHSSIPLTQQAKLNNVQC